MVGQFACQLARLSGAFVMGMDRLPLRLRVAGVCDVDAVVNPAEDDPAPVAQELTRGHGMDGAVMAFGGDGTPAFRQIVAEAAADAGRTIEVLEVRTQAPDHPILLAVPETEYLKCLILRAE